MRRPTRTIWKAKCQAPHHGDGELLQLYYWPTESLSLSAELDAAAAPKLAKALRQIASGQKLGSAGTYATYHHGTWHFGAALLTEAPHLNLHFIAISARDDAKTSSAGWCVRLTPRLARTIADAIDAALAPQQVAA